MSLPTEIQRQADLADSIVDGLTGEQKQEATQQGGEPQQQVTEDSGKTQTETNEARGVDQELEKLKSRYSSLRGKYDSEVPRLSQRNQELEEDLRRLTEENNKLREETIKAQAKGLTSEDEEQFGSDFVDMVRRGVQEETTKLQSEVERLRSELKQQKNVLVKQESTVAETRASGFYAAMGEAIPDWLEQNTDEGFLEWLQQVDPVYGFQRQEMLDKAVRSFDVQRAAAIFKQYRVETAKKEAHNPLEKQVSPTRTAGSGSPTDGKTAWTSASIEQFYEDWRRGKYTEEEGDRIEQEINAAVASGKVLN